jgi:hypothetical protein
MAGPKLKNRPGIVAMMPFTRRSLTRGALAGSPEATPAACRRVGYAGSEVSAIGPPAAGDEHPSERVNISTNPEE